MKILLTNDDGYNSEGITLLFEELKNYGQVLLVAPHHHMSGASVRTKKLRSSVACCASSPHVRGLSIQSFLE